MNLALSLAAALLIAVGLAHSYLGERYILIRLFRRPDLPKLFGSQSFTARTLRFAWHLTTIAWWGFAAILLVLARPPLTVHGVGVAVGVTLLATSAAILFASRGRHLAWPVFLVAGVIALLARGA